MDEARAAEHLDDNLVDRFVAGTATEAEQDLVRAHLPTCAVCRRLISELIKETVEATDEPPVAVAHARGSQIGRYLILEKIGSGAMGTVYSAYDPKLDRKIALKLVRTEAHEADVPVLKERLLREGQAMARLVHPNVVAIHDVGESGDEVYIAMDLVDGRNVRAWLDEKPRSWREVLDVYLQAGRGLAAAHRAGLVHRDFKPDNVLVAQDGRVLVTDFGMAFFGDVELWPLLQSSATGSPLTLTQTGAVVGTPAYMAPEQLNGAMVDARADVYAFAVASWEALHGQHPFPINSLHALRMATLADRIQEPQRTEVPARVRRALRAALRADPTVRTPTLDPLLDALEASRPRGRLRRLALTAVVLVAAGALTGAVRLAIIARADARDARAHAELARRLGEEVAAMELGLRAERLMPLHDLEPAERAARTRLDEMRGALRGTAGDAAIHDALGRGLAALRDDAAARVELERALALGADHPTLHFILGHTLVRLHDHALDDARRMGGPSWVAARRAVLAAQYLPIALVHLERSRGGARGSPELLEALLAYQAGDLERALVTARAASASRPLFYESRLVEGTILEQRGQDAADAGDQDAADRLYAEAIEALERAALIARSDASIHDAIARVWIRRLDLIRYSPDVGRRLGLMAAALLATDRALAAAPRAASSHTRRAHIFMHSGLAEMTRRHAFQLDHLNRCMSWARAAAELDPNDALALLILGDCHMLDAVHARTAMGLQAAAIVLAGALRISPGFPWAANDLCQSLAMQAEQALNGGRDPTAIASRAIASCDLATRLDPGYVIPWLTFVDAGTKLVEAGARRGYWDQAIDARVRAAIDRAASMGGVEPAVLLVISLPLAVARLEHAGRTQGDVAGATAKLDGILGRLDAEMPPEWNEGEPGLMILEARLARAHAAGDTGAAAAALERCLALAPDRLRCRLAQATSGSLEDARRLVRDFPELGRAWLVLAEARSRTTGDAAPPRAALELAATALALAPELAEAHAAVGRLEWRRARSASDSAAAGRALAAFERAVGLSPPLARLVGSERAEVVAFFATRAGAERR